MSPLHVTILLLSLAAPILSDYCPDEDAISPCMCGSYDDLDVDFTFWCPEGSQPEIQRAFEHLRGKKNMAVELAWLALGGLPPNFFRDIQVKKLLVSHCELEGLEGVEGKPALLGLEDSLEEFEVYNSLGKYKKQLAINLGHLRRLERLELGGNNITEIGNDWFKNGPISLMELVIFDNNVEVLGDRAFQSLTNLKYFMLQGNRFKTVHRSILPMPANRLHSLDLSNNMISELPEDMFVGMPSLRAVILNENSIHQLPETTWNPVWKQLKDLAIEENPLQCDSDMNWIAQLGSPEELHGSCVGPFGKEGILLKDLIF